MLMPALTGYYAPSVERTQQLNKIDRQTDRQINAPAVAAAYFTHARASDGRLPRTSALIASERFFG